MVSVSMPPALSSMTIDPGSTVIVITGRDLGLLAGVERVVDQLLDHDQRPVVDASARSGSAVRARVQNSISRETLKATRVSFGSGFACERPGSGFATICKN